MSKLAINLTFIVLAVFGVVYTFFLFPKLASIRFIKRLFCLDNYPPKLEQRYSNWALLFFLGFFLGALLIIALLFNLSGGGIL